MVEAADRDNLLVTIQVSQYNMLRAARDDMKQWSLFSLDWLMYRSAFNDRDAGSNANRRHGTDDGERQDRHRGGRDQTSYSRGGRGRGGTRGGRGSHLTDDRHSRSGFE